MKITVNKRKKKREKFLQQHLNHTPPHSDEVIDQRQTDLNFINEQTEQAQ